MYRKTLALIAIFALLLTLMTGMVTIPASAAGTYQRLAGADRYGTSAAISRKGWESADAVVIACGEDFPDGLAGGPLAYKLNAPLLITKKDSLPAAAAKEIDRLKPQKAYILGGPGVVSDSVKQMLEDKGISVERIYGVDRAATASEIAKIIGAPDGKAVIATGLDFPDALAVSPVAAINNQPILFVYRSVIPPATLETLNDLKIKHVDVLGGPAVVSDSIVNKLKDMGITVKRIYGSNRELTALEIAKTYGDVANGVFLATGRNFVDALSATPLAAKNRQPLLLCGKDTVDKNVSAYIKNSALVIDKVTAIGGEDAVSTVAVSKLFNNGVIQIYQTKPEKQIFGNKTVNNIYFTVDNIPGAVAYELYVRYSQYDFSWSSWYTSSFSLDTNGKAYFDIPFDKKGSFWAEIHALDEKDNVLASSEPFALEVDARDPNGRLIVYTDEQLISAVSPKVDPLISDSVPQIKEYYSKAKSIISKIIKPGMTDLQKEKAVHDYIVNNTRYDKINYNKGTVPDKSYSPYGVLIKGTAICEGYAKATALLLNMAGIESMVVSGGGHAWNIVKIDGKYYHLDTTWDDPVSSSGENILRYDYFNLSDEEIGKDHFWDKGNCPACPKPGPRP